MIFVAIGGILGIIGGLKLGRKVAPFSTRLFVVLVAILCACMGGLIAAYTGGYLPSNYVLKQEIQLTSIKSPSGIISVYLGFNDLASPDYYIYFQETKNGLKITKLSTGSPVSIYEEKRNDGVIKKYKQKFKSRWSYLIGFPREKKYEFFIPKGSMLGMELDRIY